MQEHSIFHASTGSKWVNELEKWVLFWVTNGFAMYMQFTFKKKGSMNRYIDLNKRDCIIKVAFEIFFFSFIPFMYA